MGGDHRTKALKCENEERKVSSLQRYFVSPEQIAQDRVTISGGDAHHIARVMRFNPGDTVIVCDNSGKQFTVRLEKINDQTVAGQVIGEQMAVSEPRLRVTLVPSLLKGDKLEWIIQKGTEMGVHAIWPFHSARSVVQLDGTKAVKRRERWQKIAKEAAEQAHRGFIPEIDGPLTWMDILDRIAAFDIAIIPHEREQKQSLPALWHNVRSIETCLIIIGPEGGFDDREVDMAREAGARPVHLGPRILRAETAALTTITCLMWAGGELGD